MILGVGTDIVQRNRVKLDVAKRVLSNDEISIMKEFKLENRKLEYLAGRFSIKEAIIKAISNTKYKLGMRDIVILNDDLGKPYIVKPIYDDIRIHISLSHENDYCVGMCVIENV